ncbi:hypothetical protein PMAYCL1PPCAC_20230, partial [Pristionchus mayeri]
CCVPMRTPSGGIPVSPSGPSGPAVPSTPNGLSCPTFTYDQTSCDAAANDAGGFTCTAPNYVNNAVMCPTSKPKIIVYPVGTTPGMIASTLVCDPATLTWTIASGAISLPQPTQGILMGCTNHP